MSSCLPCKSKPLITSPQLRRIFSRHYTFHYYLALVNRFILLNILCLIILISLEFYFRGGISVPNLMCVAILTVYLYLFVHLNSRLMRTRHFTYVAYLCGCLQLLLCVGHVPVNWREAADIPSFGLMERTSWNTPHLHMGTNMWLLAWLSISFYAFIPLRLALKICVATLMAIVHLSVLLFGPDVLSGTSARSKFISLIQFNRSEINFFLADVLILFSINVIGTATHVAVSRGTQRAFMESVKCLRKKKDFEVERNRLDKLIAFFSPGLLVNDLKQDFLNVDSSPKDVPLVIHLKNISLLSVDISNVGHCLCHTENGQFEKEVISFLGILLDIFDNLAQEHDCYCVNTNGEEILFLAGYPSTRVDHAKCVVDLGLAMLNFIKQLCMEAEVNLEIRLAAHTGEVFASFLSEERITFDLYGEDVEHVNALRRRSAPGHLCTSASNYQQLPEGYKGEPVSFRENVSFPLQIQQAYYMKSRLSVKNSNSEALPNSPIGSASLFADSILLTGEAAQFPPLSGLFSERKLQVFRLVHALQQIQKTLKGSTEVSKKSANPASFSPTAAMDRHLFLAAGSVSEREALLLETNPLLKTTSSWKNGLSQSASQKLEDYNHLDVGCDSDEKSLVSLPFLQYLSSQADVIGHHPLHHILSTTSRSNEHGSTRKDGSGKRHQAHITCAQEDVLLHFKALASRIHLVHFCLRFADKSVEGEFQMYSNGELGCNILALLALLLLSVAIQAISLLASSILLLMCTVALLSLGIILIIVLSSRLNCFKFHIEKSFIGRSVVMVMALCLCALVSQVNLFFCSTNATLFGISLVNETAITATATSDVTCPNILYGPLVVCLCSLFFLCVPRIHEVCRYILALILLTASVGFLFVSHNHRFITLGNVTYPKIEYVYLYRDALLPIVMFTLLVMVLLRSWDYIHRLAFLWNHCHATFEKEFESYSMACSSAVKNVLPSYVASRFVGQSSLLSTISDITGQPLYSDTYEKVGVLMIHLPFRTAYNGAIEPTEVANNMHHLHQLLCKFDELCDNVNQQQQQQNMNELGIVKVGMFGTVLCYATGLGVRISQNGTPLVSQSYKSNLQQSITEQVLALLHLAISLHQAASQLNCYWMDDRIRIRMSLHIANGFSALLLRQRAKFVLVGEAMSVARELLHFPDQDVSCNIPECSGASSSVSLQNTPMPSIHNGASSSSITSVSQSTPYTMEGLLVHAAYHSNGQGASCIVATASVVQCLTKSQLTNLGGGGMEFLLVGKMNMPSTLQCQDGSVHWNFTDSGSACEAGVNGSCNISVNAPPRSSPAPGGPPNHYPNPNIHNSLHRGNPRNSCYVTKQNNNFIGNAPYSQQSQQGVAVYQLLPLHVGQAIRQMRQWMLNQAATAAAISSQQLLLQHQRSLQQQQQQILLQQQRLLATQQQMRQPLPSSTEHKNEPVYANEPVVIRLTERNYYANHKHVSPQHVYENEHPPLPAKPPRSSVSHHSSANCFRQSSIEMNHLSSASSRAGQVESIVSKLQEAMSGYPKSSSSIPSSPPVCVGAINVGNDTLCSMDSFLALERECNLAVANLERHLSSHEEEGLVTPSSTPGIGGGPSAPPPRPPKRTRSGTSSGNNTNTSTNQSNRSVALQDMQLQQQQLLCSPTTATKSGKYLQEDEKNKESPAVKNNKEMPNTKGIGSLIGKLSASHHNPVYTDNEYDSMMEEHVSGGLKRQSQSQHQSRTPQQKGNVGGKATKSKLPKLSTASVGSASDTHSNDGKSPKLSNSNGTRVVLPSPGKNEGIHVTPQQSRRRSSKSSAGGGNTSRGSSSRTSPATQQPNVTPSYNIGASQVSYRRGPGNVNADPFRSNNSGASSAANSSRVGCYGLSSPFTGYKRPSSPERPLSLLPGGSSKFHFPSSNVNSKGVTSNERQRAASNITSPGSTYIPISHGKPPIAASAITPTTPTASSGAAKDPLKHFIAQSDTYSLANTSGATAGGFSHEKHRCPADLISTEAESLLSLVGDSEQDATSCDEMELDSEQHRFPHVEATSWLGIDSSMNRSDELLNISMQEDLMTCSMELEKLCGNTSSIGDIGQMYEFMYKSIISGDGDSSAMDYKHKRHMDGAMDDIESVADGGDEEVDVMIASQTTGGFTCDSVQAQMGSNHSLLWGTALEKNIETMDYAHMADMSSPWGMHSRMVPREDNKYEEQSASMVKEPPSTSASVSVSSLPSVAPVRIPDFSMITGAALLNQAIGNGVNANNGNVSSYSQPVTRIPVARSNLRPIDPPQPNPNASRGEQLRQRSARHLRGIGRGRYLSRGGSSLERGAGSDYDNVRSLGSEVSSRDGREMEEEDSLEGAPKGTSQGSGTTSEGNNSPGLLPCPNYLSHGGRTTASSYGKRSEYDNLESEESVADSSPYLKSASGYGGSGLQRNRKTSTPVSVSSANNHSNSQLSSGVASNLLAMHTQWASAGMKSYGAPQPNWMMTPATQSHASSSVSSLISLDQGLPQIWQSRTTMDQRIAQEARRITNLLRQQQSTASICSTSQGLGGFEEGNLNDDDLLNVDPHDNSFAGSTGSQDDSQFLSIYNSLLHMNNGGIPHIFEGNISQPGEWVVPRVVLPSLALHQRYMALRRVHSSRCLPSQETKLSEYLDTAGTQSPQCAPHSLEPNDSAKLKPPADSKLDRMRSRARCMRQLLPSELHAYVLPSCISQSSLGSNSCLDWDEEQPRNDTTFLLGNSQTGNMAMLGDMNNHPALIPQRDIVSILNKWCLRRAEGIWGSDSLLDFCRDIDIRCRTMEEDSAPESNGRHSFFLEDVNHLASSRPWPEYDSEYDNYRSGFVSEDESCASRYAAPMDFPKIVLKNRQPQRNVLRNGHI